MSRERTSATSVFADILCGIQKKHCVTVFAEGTERGWLWLSFFWNTFSNSTVTWFNHLRDSVWQKPSSTHTKSVFKDKYCSFHWLQIKYFYIFYIFIYFMHEKSCQVSPSIRFKLDWSKTFTCRLLKNCWIQSFAPVQVFEWLCERDRQRRSRQLCQNQIHRYLVAKWVLQLSAHIIK